MNISVIGSGKSGFAAAKLAKQNGNEVFVSENGDIDRFQNEVKYYDTNGIGYEFGGNSDRVLNTDLIISSPGVPPQFEYFKKARKQGIAIISELEYAYTCLKGQKSIIAVTGTNGKTTIVNLIHHILKSCNIGSVLCGNVGTPLSEIIGSEKDKVVIIEASSYQLDRIDTFSPDVAIISNITPDHLQYHGSIVEYFHAKWKITSNQKQSSLLILNKDDSILFNSNRGAGSDSSGELSIKDSDAQLLYFSHEVQANGAFVEKDWIYVKQHKDSGEFMPLSQIAIPGCHNVYNTMAALLSCRYLEIPDEDIRDSIASFKGVEHRLEYVAKVDEADWYNDSKATNINAAWYALSSFERPIIWIAGGEAEDNDYFELADLVKQRVKNVIAFGAQGSEIFSVYSSQVACDKVDDLEAAVQLANSLAESGDIILLSPACKSFDQYLNFEERGNHFKMLVRALL